MARRHENGASVVAGSGGRRRHEVFDREGDDGLRVSVGGAAHVVKVSGERVHVEWP